MSLQKTIKCVRCHGLKVVPNDWQYKECKPCHERTNRRRLKGKVPIEKIEQKAVDNFVNFESAWRRYKRHLRQWKAKGMSKERFREDYFHSQQLKIAQIKAVIAKYDSKDAPIMNSDCLRFRRLFSKRQSYVDTTKFADDISAEESNLFYNHIGRCSSCNRYAVTHKYDAPTVQNDYKEEGVSQEEFDSALTEFFNTMKPKKDKIDQILDSMEDVPYDDGEI